MGLIAGNGASLLIDTPLDGRLTREMLTAFEPFTAQAPIKKVINTHPDLDHWWGNAWLPQAEVIASDAAAKQMRHESPPYRVRTLRRVASMAGGLPGSVGRMGRYVTSFLGPCELDDHKIRFPDRTFTKSVTETIGGRTVEIIELGPTHTASDSIVFVPDARVVFTGDLVFTKVTPIMWHGPVSTWINALEKIMALDADVYVPGHGPVSTRIELMDLLNYWTWLNTAVIHHKKAGLGIREIINRLVTAREFAAFAGWKSPERLYVSVTNIYRDLDGRGALPQSPINQARCMHAMANLAPRLCHPQLSLGSEAGTAR